MVDYLLFHLPDVCCIAIDTGSRGTADMIRRCEAARIPVYRYVYNGTNPRPPYVERKGI